MERQQCMSLDNAARTQNFTTEAVVASDGSLFNCTARADACSVMSARVMPQNFVDVGLAVR